MYILSRRHVTSIPCSGAIKQRDHCILNRQYFFERTTNQFDPSFQSRNSWQRSHGKQILTKNMHSWVKPWLYQHLGIFPSKCNHVNRDSNYYLHLSKMILPLTNITNKKALYQVWMKLANQNLLTFVNKNKMHP